MLMMTGIEVLFVSIGMLVVLWAIILYGSQYFGSTD
jgi:hypothetical protein